MKNKLKPVFYMATGAVLAVLFAIEGAREWTDTQKDVDRRETEELLDELQRRRVNPTVAEKSADEFSGATRSQQRESALRNELAGMTGLAVKTGGAVFDNAKWNAKVEELREARADIVRRGENPLGPSGGEMLLGGITSQIPSFNKEEVEKWRAAHPAEEQKAQEVIAQEKKSREESEARVEAEETAKDEKEVQDNLD